MIIKWKYEHVSPVGCFQKTLTLKLFVLICLTLVLLFWLKSPLLSFKKTRWRKMSTHTPTLVHSWPYNPHRKLYVQISLFTHLWLTAAIWTESSCLVLILIRGHVLTFTHTFPISRRRNLQKFCYRSWCPHFSFACLLWGHYNRLDGSSYHLNTTL